MAEIGNLSTYPNFSFRDVNTGMYYQSSDYHEISKLGIKFSEPLHEDMKISLHGREVQIKEIQVQIQDFVGDYKKGRVHSVYGYEVPYPVAIYIYTEDL